MRIALHSYRPPVVAHVGDARLEVLGPQHAEPDFAAVCASVEAIRHVFGPESGWPGETITFAENLADLIRHESEFHADEAYAYAILRASDSAYLGCFYLLPMKVPAHAANGTPKFAARAYYWLSVLHDTWNEPVALATLDEWLEATWGLRPVAWPGRRIPWQEWQQLHGGRDAA